MVLSYPHHLAAGQTDASTSVTGLQWKGNIRDVRKDYLKVLKQFRQQVCSAEKQQKFDELFKRYKHEGFYIPLVRDNELDERTIRDNLPLLKEKVKWIESLHSSLQKQKRIPSIKKVKRQINDKVDELLELKKQHVFAENSAKKRQISKKSKQKLQELEGLFDKLKDQIPFMLSFKHPVDHFQNRLAYEKALAQANKSVEQERKKNSIYFRRRLFEDGTSNKHGHSSDHYVRTTFDTIALNLPGDSDFISEDLRYDLDWVLGRTESFLRKGRRAYLKRLKRWQEKTESTLSFYEKLIERQPASETTGSKVAREKAEASAQLKDFVLRQQAKVYAYFAKQPEIMQALFTFDEVLLNEVGRATVYNYRDRKDIAQIVINRRQMPEFSQLNATHPLRPYLREEGVSSKVIDNSHWLNVMFKYKEFSFTLYFIPAVKYTFCPDTYSVARSTRRKNVALALYQLRNPNSSFEALRYFSRFSMTGKISMDEMWKGFQPVPERPGRKLKNTASLKKALQSNKYRYFYHFKDRKGRSFHVVEIKGTTYAVTGLRSTPVFYNHRNRHKFTYFEPKKS